MAEFGKSKFPALDPDNQEKLNKKLLAAFSWSIKTLNAGDVERLLETGADINTTDKLGDTALIKATKRSSHEVACLLLQKGADPNIKNKVGKAPLFFALENNLFETVKLLLEHKAEKEEYFKEKMDKLNKRFLNKMKNEKIQKNYVEKFLKVGDVNFRDEDGNTALMLAYSAMARYRSGPEIVSLLLKEGADPNIKNNDGNSPLLAPWSNKYFNFEEVERLLEAGADINIQDKRGDTALMKATKRHSPRVAYLLLQKGADPNIRNNAGMSPLNVASINGLNDIVKLLLDDGALKGGQMDELNRKFLRRIKNEEVSGVKNGQIKTVDVETFIKVGGDVNIRDEDGNTFLMLAILAVMEDRCCPEVVSLLLQEGADPNNQDRLGDTALIKATKNKRQEVESRIKILRPNINIYDLSNLSFVILQRLHKVAYLLLEKGADPNIKNSDGKAPLFFALENDLLETVKLLLKHKAEKDEYFKVKMDKLTKQFLNKMKKEKIQKNVVENFLKVGDVNIRDEDGNTALLLASLAMATEGSGPEIVSLLLQEGADPNIKNRDGHSPLYLALRNQHKGTLDLLLSHGALKDENFFNHSAKLGADLLQICHRKKMNIEIEKVETLLEINVDTDTKDEKGWTSLIHSASAGRKEVVALLLKYRADINARDNDGATALFWASEHGHHEVVELLLQENADPNIKNIEGNSPLYLALLNGNKKIERLLRNSDAMKNKTDFKEALADAFKDKKFKTVYQLLNNDFFITGENPSDILNILLDKTLSSLSTLPVIDLLFLFLHEYKDKEDYEDEKKTMKGMQLFLNKNYPFYLIETSRLSSSDYKKQVSLLSYIINKACENLFL